MFSAAYMFMLDEDEGRVKKVEKTNNNKKKTNNKRRCNFVVVELETSGTIWDNVTVNDNDVDVEIEVRRGLSVGNLGPIFTCLFMSY
jgi:hypothetical protein